MPSPLKSPSPAPHDPAAPRPAISDATHANGRTTRRRPLPDAQAIRAVAVPDLAPPYDDSEPVTQVTKPLHASNGTAVADPGGSSSPRPALITGAWPSQFAQVLSETLAGSRPASQLTPWTTEQARERISQLGPMLAASRQPKVRRVIITSPVPGVLEMTVIVDIGSRERAGAVRLQHPSPSAPSAVGQTQRATGPQPPAWLCTAVEAA